MARFDELLRGLAAAPRVATTDERIGAHLGRFRLLSKLGFGATSVVYRARDEALERDVAVKMLRKRFPIATQQAWLSCEARRASRVKHANIACVYDVGEASGVFFVVMELVEGETVSRAMPAGGYAWDEAVRIVRGVAAGLAAAHEAGLVHGDLTPSNIAIDRDGTPKLLDFGLAMASGDRPPRSRGSSSERARSSNASLALSQR